MMKIAFVAVSAKSWTIAAAGSTSVVTRVVSPSFVVRKRFSFASFPYSMPKFHISPLARSSFGCAEYSAPSASAPLMSSSPSVASVSGSSR